MSTNEYDSEMRLNPVKKEVCWIVVTNTILTESWLKSILDMLKDQSYRNKFIYTNGNLYEMKMGYFLLEFKLLEEININILLFAQLTNKTISLQAPRLCWRFEYEGLHYLILYAEMNTRGETNNYLYRGMIVNPKEYMQNLKKSL